MVTLSAGQALLAALLVALCHLSAGQPMRDVGRRAEKPELMRSDLKYIECGVCEQVAKQAYRQYKKLLAEKGDKLEEYDIINVLEKVCSHSEEQGAWIEMVDLQEQGDELKVVDMGEVGECGRECHTVAKSCEQIMGDYDTDLAEALYKGMNRADLQNLLCNQLSQVCSKKPPPLPADRPAGPAFKALSDEDVKLQKMMSKMEQDGMSGQLFDRQAMEAEMERLQAMQQGQQEGGEEDEKPIGGAQQTFSKLQEDYPKYVSHAKKLWQQAVETMNREGPKVLEKGKKLMQQGSEVVQREGPKALALSKKFMQRGLERLQDSLALLKEQYAMYNARKAAQQQDAGNTKQEL